MPSKYDIFISYGHLDDEDPAGDMKGWVDLLVERLPRLVSGSLGYLPKMWRDQRSLTGDALLRAAIEEGITHSLLFLPICHHATSSQTGVSANLKHSPKIHRFRMRLHIVRESSK